MSLKRNTFQLLKSPNVGKIVEKIGLGSFLNKRVLSKKYQSRSFLYQQFNAVSIELCAALEFLCPLDVTTYRPNFTRLSDPIVLVHGKNPRHLRILAKLV